jgi:hypothetical protein
MSGGCGGRLKTAILAAVASAVGACSGGSKFDGTSIYVQAGVPAQVGENNFSVLLQDASGHCPLSVSSTLTINDGQTLPFSSCTGGAYGFEGNPSFTLRAVDGDDRAEMIVEDLVPGVAATVAAPADGQVAAGANLTVSVPPSFQGQSPVIAEFREAAPLDGYDGTETYPVLPYSLAIVQSAFDVPAPQHPASYTFQVLMDATPSGPVVLGHVLSCSGFAYCAASGAEVLGPMTVMVTP